MTFGPNTVRDVATCSIQGCARKALRSDVARSCNPARHLASAVGSGWLPATRSTISSSSSEREAAAALLAEVGALDLSAADREALATDLATAAELAADLDP
jgi:hypothetical protein